MVEILDLKIYSVNDEDCLKVHAAAQVILACAATAWFLIVTRESDMGNSWHATAQLISE